MKTKNRNQRRVTLSRSLSDSGAKLSITCFMVSMSTVMFTFQPICSLRKMQSIT